MKIAYRVVAVFFTSHKVSFDPFINIVAKCINNV